jgi:group I intron endonuclease
MPIKPENIGIYKITDQTTGMVYVGSSKEMNTRRRNHVTYLRKGKHHNRKLQNAWTKHGEPSFLFEIIEICTIPKLQEREQFWIDKLNACDRISGFNILPFAFRQLKTKQRCLVCGKEAQPIRKGRCHACNEYHRRHKKERPYKENAFLEAREKLTTQTCPGCNRPVTIAGHAAKGICKSCYRRKYTRRQTIAKGNLKIEFEEIIIIDLNDPIFNEPI